MITGTGTNISGVTDYVDSTQSATTTTSKTTLGKDAFLKLLLAQLNNQDPLNPADATEFSSQLAQFSSLEQMTNINDTLTSLLDSQESSNKYNVLNMIGKEIEAGGDTINLGDTGTAAGSFTIEGDADCTAVIYDANGAAIKTINLGSLKSGDHVFRWDGTEQDGDKADQGSYSFEIIAENASGESVGTETRIRGVVDKVNMESNDPTLFIGSLSIPLSEISNITLSGN
jgi:flagellar basal-body rod modification protein FlgD